MFAQVGQHIRGNQDDDELPGARLVAGNPRQQDDQRPVPKIEAVANFTSEGDWPEAIQAIKPAR